ncbi:MAG: quercetin 2,3-dioxygenase [Solirubrobacterales bacterium]|nr:quercetin 2,3-dioxygenase [Solirubrobacterales bacterium]
MVTTDATGPTPSAIKLQPGEGEARWFLGALVTVKSSGETTEGRVAVIEHHAPQGHGSPLHVHHNEDEWFYVTEGELTFWLDGEVTTAPAGSFVYLPRDAPHTFSVSSAEARFLLVVEPAGFEGFVRESSEPAAERTLPPATVQLPSPEQMTATAAKYGLDILGPPGIPA